MSYAIAIYPFQPSTTSNAELPLQIGDQLYIIEEGGKDCAWCRGYLLQPPSLLSSLTSRGQVTSDARVFSGIFPKCCVGIKEQLGHDVAPPSPTTTAVRPQAPVPMLKIGDESATSESEPLVDEIASCLREWYTGYVPTLVLQRDYDRLDTMADIVQRLDYARRQLLNDVLTAQERTSVREDAVWDLVRGNKLLGAEVIVRDPAQKGRLLTARDSATRLTQLQARFALFDGNRVVKQDGSRLHHCLLTVLPSGEVATEDISLTFALYQKSVHRRVTQLSETFTVTGVTKTSTLFADLSSLDFASDDRLFLVARALVSEPPKQAAQAILSEDRPQSRSETLQRTRDSMLNRRTSKMGFTAKRKPDKSPIIPSGRAMTPVSESSNSTPRQGYPEAKKKTTSSLVPRVIAFGTFDLAPTMRSGEETVLNLGMWESATDANTEEEIAWPGILPELLQTRNLQFVRCSRFPSVSIEVKPFTSPSADLLVRSSPTSMHMIAKTQRIGFSEAPATRRSDIYLNIGKITLPAGGAFSHPQFGAVPIKPVQMLNMQITMELRDGSGQRLERCIYPSSDASAVTAMRTHAVELDTLWDQTICIRLPVDRVMDAHLILSIANAPEFPFALAWMPLWDQYAFLRDGPHSLILHAYDKSTSTFSDAGKGMYLDLPWDHSALNKQSGAQIASLQVGTTLVSTELSQDSTLANLFNWKTLSSVSLYDVLQKLVFVPEVEVVTQLNEVLDALFAILDYKAGKDNFEDLIFNDIVFVLGIVHDRRYNLGPLIEHYVDDHFKAPMVAPCLVRSLTRLLHGVLEPQSARAVRALFKVGQQFMRLLMACYWQHPHDPDEDDIDDEYTGFKEDMKAVFMGLQLIMRNETPSLIGTKTLLVNNLHTWLPEMLKVYTNREVIALTNDMIDACKDVTGTLALYRLILIANYVKLERLWIDDDDWTNLIGDCVGWLERHWPVPNTVTKDWKEQVRLCSSIVAALLARPSPALHLFNSRIIATYTTIAAQPKAKRWDVSALFPAAYPFTLTPTVSADYFDETLLELAALLADIMKIKAPPERQWDHTARTREVTQTLSVAGSILSHNMNPASWLSLDILNHVAALDLLTYIAGQLERFYLPDPEDATSFDTGLWKSYFDALLILLLSSALALESFSEQKRRAVWKIAGDVRQTGSDLLRASWIALGWEATEDDRRRYHLGRLGGYQVQYVPSLVAPIMELCLSMHEGLRRVGVEILQAMIISEWTLNEELSLIETEIIGALNDILKARSLSSQPTGNEIVARKLFVGELLASFSTIANQPDDALWRTLEDLVATIDELIDLISGPRLDEDAEASAEDDEPRFPLPPSRTNGTRTVTPITAARADSAELAERSISRLEGKVYGSHALECYKRLAEEYEKSGDFKRLAKTYRAIARIHEARATSRLSYHRGEADGIDEDDE